MGRWGNLLTKNFPIFLSNSKLSSQAARSATQNLKLPPNHAVD